MAEFLAGMNTFFQQSFLWLGDVLDTVIEKPALMILVLAMPIVGFVVGLFSRLIRA